MTTSIKNIQHWEDNIKHHFKSSLVGYLDDTTWFGSSIQQINHKLSIANSFYKFTKSKLTFTNTKSSQLNIMTPDYIDLNINDQDVAATISSNKQG